MTDYNIAAALTDIKHYYYYFSSNHLSQSLVFGVSVEPLISIHLMTDYNIAVAQTDIEHWTGAVSGRRVKMADFFVRIFL